MSVSTLTKLAPADEYTSKMVSSTAKITSRVPILLLIFLLAACGAPSEQAEQEVAEPTASSVPANTPIPPTEPSPTAIPTAEPTPTEAAPTAVVPTPTPEPLTLESDLVAWYLFDGSAEDQTANANNGTLDGATATTDRFGNENGALALDGVDDFVIVPHSDSLALRTQMTLSAWFHFEAQTAPGTFYSLIEKTDPERDGHSRWGIWIIDDLIWFCVQPNTSQFHYCEDTGEGLQPDEWNHVVGSWDSTRIAIFVNGQLVLESNNPRAGISSTNHELYFGTDPHDSSPVFLKGAIDDVRIYKRALSDDEVVELHQLESAGMVVEGEMVVDSAEPTQPHTPQLTSETVTLPSVDNLPIVATYSYDAATTTPQPAILLLHMLNSNRAAWNPIVPALQDAGYAVMAVDMRGHGETGGERNWALADQDMNVMLSWLSSQPTVDGSRLYTMGGSIGANMAIRAAANWSPDDPANNVNAVIMLSGGLDYRGVTTEEPLAAYGDNPVLIVAAEADTYAANSARTLAEQAPGNSTLIVYDGRAHGTSLLEAQPDMIPTILDFLAQH